VTFNVDVADRRRLLDLARATVEATARHASRPAIGENEITPGLQEEAATFVTLRKGGELRGCIGLMRYDAPLWMNVRDSARAAAREDPRFMPVAESELPDIELEISVLEAPRLIGDPSEFVAGRDGILIERGGCRGLLLPQVAAEMGWGEAQMLEAVCRKAGLRPDAWRDPATRLYVFQATCFSCGAEG
jgi:AmmeMemoRadiSam system protein A